MTPIQSTQPSDAVSRPIVESDLDSICKRLAEHLGKLPGERVLITGGAGFLGHYLVRTLLHWNRMSGSRPVHVTVLDNYVRGVPSWLGRVRNDAELAILQHDIAEPLASEKGAYSYILHAASIASPTYYRLHPIQTMDANVQGVRNLLEYCRARQGGESEVKGMLFFSSSEIYGDPDALNIPTAEDYRGFVSCTGPRACYDESKRFGETLCVNFARRYGIRVMIARPFNNYGPGLRIDDRRVIPDFARDILYGKNIVLLSDGSPKRTFCYVADAVAGYFQVLFGGRAGEPYNIGAEEPELSIAELAETMREIAVEEFGYSGAVVRAESADKDYLTHNPVRRRPSIEKARAEVGFNPQVSLRDGLRRSLIWYRQIAEREGRQ